MIRYTESKHGKVKMKLFFTSIVLFVAVLLETGHAQIGGLSASKLSAINSETVPRFTIEFEPSFVIGYAKRYWDRYGKNKSLFKDTDSLQVISEMDFRFTYGVTSRWEMGFTLPTGMKFLSLGSKYRFLKKDKYALAVLNGFNLPLGNHVYHITYRHNTKSEYDVNILLGLAATYTFNQKFSVDLNPVLQSHLDRGFSHLVQHVDVFFNTDFGYYFTDGFQGIIGVYYFKTRGGLNSNYAQKLTVNPGFTIEKARHFIIVMNFPFDVWGRNSEIQVGMGFALTIWIN